MSWFSRKKRPEIFVSQGTQKTIDHLLEFTAKHFSLGTEMREVHVPSHEYYCSEQEITAAEIKILVEHISGQLNIDKRLEVRLFSTQKVGYEIIMCNHHCSGDDVQSLFLPDGITKLPIHLNASIVQQLCEIHAAKIVTDQMQIQDIGTIISFCCGFGIFQTLSVTLPCMSPHLHLSPFSYEAMLYSAASLHDLGFSVIDKYQFYVDNDTWLRLRDLVNALPDLPSRSKFRTEWNKSLEQSNDFIIAFGKPIHEQETMEALERLAKKRPDDYNVIHNLAYARLLHGQYELACKGFDFAISANPYFAYAFNNRGLCNIFLGKMGAALEDLKTSARLDPENSFNNRNFGIYWLKRNKPEIALDEFLKAQELDATTEHIHYWLGCAYLALGRGTEAMKEFELSRQVPELPAPEYPATF